MSEQFDYILALEKREVIEAELKKAYDQVFEVQERFNAIDQEIQDYEQEQAVLDE